MQVRRFVPAVTRFVPVRLVLAIALVVGLASAVATARQGVMGEWVIQPHEHTSRDGRWKLAVDPTQRDAAGEADYALTHDGKSAWQGRLPFTLLDAAVANDGTFVGYAYTGGVERAQGECVLVTIGVRLTDGADEAQVVERGRFTTVRRGSREPEGQSEPAFGGVRLAEEQGFWLVRAQRLAREEAETRVLRIELASGLPLGSLDVPHCKPLAERAAAYLLDVKPLVGTPLLLTYRSRTDDVTRSDAARGAHFELFDFDGRSIWELDRPNEYGPSPAQGPNPREARAWLAEPLSIRESPGRFAVLLASEEVRLECAVERVDDGWKVRELERTPSPLPPLRDAAREPRPKRR